jgi:hypothetical protein
VTPSSLWYARFRVLDPALLCPAASHCLQLDSAGHRPRELLGLMAAGVEALVAMWGAFERGWHAGWLALRAATPPADLNPRLCVPVDRTPHNRSQLRSTCCVLVLVKNRLSSRAELHMLIREKS